MKYIAFILTIYICALSLVPCEDNGIYNDEVKTEITHSTSDDHSDSDLCSPFCQCHCCHVHVVNIEIAEFSLELNEISSVILFQPIGLAKDFKSSPFQPPQA